MSINWPGTDFNGRKCGVTNGSPTVVVSGNLAMDFSNTDPGAQGNGFLGPDERLYAIASALSYDAAADKTTLTLARNYRGTTVVLDTAKTRSNNCQAGSTNSTIKLDAGASAVDNFYNNCLVTNNGETRVIVSYVGATKIATIGALDGSAATWTTAPTTGSAYTVSGSGQRFDVPPHQGLAAAAAWQLQQLMNLLAQSPTSVASVAALKALPAVVNRVATLTGYFTDGDSGPARQYKMVNVNPGTADNGVIITSDTAGYWWVWQNVPREIDIRTFGAVLDDATDNYAVLKNALAYINTRGYGSLYVPGKLAVASASWYAGGSITMTALGKVKIKGLRGLSWVRITGTTPFTNGLVFQNCGPVHFRDIELVGNSLGGSGNDRFFYFHMTGAATKPMDDLRIAGCRIRNFQTDMWLYYHNEAGTFPMRAHITDNDFVSQAGNSYDPTNLGVSSDIITLQGCSTGKVTAQVHRNRADGNYVKKFLVCFHDTADVFATHNSLDNFGQSGANDSKGGRCFQVYNNSGNDPQNININFNAARSPRNFLYTAATSEVNCIGNFVTGQNDIIDASLPCGVFALNNSYGNICDNEMRECFAGITATGATQESVILARNKFSSSVANAYAIRLPGNIANDALQKFICADNDLLLTGTGSIGYKITGSGSGSNGFIQISGGRVAAGRSCIEASDGAGGGLVCTSLQVGGGIVLAGGCTSFLISVTSSTSPICLDGIVLNAAAIAAAANGLVATGSTNIDINDIVAKNKTSGAGVMLSVDGCRGRMRNVRRDNVADANFYTSTDFGHAKPTWSAAQGTIIQRFIPNEFGSAGSKYIVAEWCNVSGSTTWQELRSLTGN